LKICVIDGLTFNTTGSNIKSSIFPKGSKESTGPLAAQARGH